MLEGTLNVLSLVSTVTVGLVFVAAGLAKVRDRRLFRSALDAHGYLPRLAQRVLLVVLPPVEVALGVVVVSGIAFGAANVLAAALLVIFTTAVAFGSRGKGRLDCGCFGSVLGASTLRDLAARNALLIALALLPAAIGAPDAVVSISVAAGTVLAVAILLFARQIVARVLMDVSSGVGADNPGRRSFLRSLSAVGGGALLLGLARVTGVEAACSYCGSCSQEILWVGCTGGCCAAYWVRDRKSCDGSCLACSSWRLEEWCSAWECC